MKNGYINVNGIRGKLVHTGKHGVVLSQKFYGNGYWFVPFANACRIYLEQPVIPIGDTKKKCIEYADKGGFE